MHRDLLLLFFMHADRDADTGLPLLDRVGH